MNIDAGSTLYVLVPVSGPAGVDLTAYPVDLAFVTDPTVAVPDGAWHSAQWIDGEAAILVGPGSGGTVIPPGEYYVKARPAVGNEAPILTSGRVTQQG